MPLSVILKTVAPTRVALGLGSMQPSASRWPTAAKKVLVPGTIPTSAATAAGKTSTSVRPVACCSFIACSKRRAISSENTGSTIYSYPVALRRIPLPRTRVNKARERAGSKDPALLITASELLLVGRLLQACALLLRLARSLPSIVERHAGERFSPLLEEALVCFVALLKDLKDPARKILVGLRLMLHALRSGPSDLLGYLVVPLAGGYPVLRGYPGAFLGALGVTLGDPSQVLEIHLGHHGRGHFIDTSVGSGLVQFQIFTYHAPGAAKHPWRTSENSTSTQSGE